MDGPSLNKDLLLMLPPELIKNLLKYLDLKSINRFMNLSKLYSKLYPKLIINNVDIFPLENRDCDSVRNINVWCMFSMDFYNNILRFYYNMVFKDKINIQKGNLEEDTFLFNETCMKFYKLKYELLLFYMKNNQYNPWLVKELHPDENKILKYKNKLEGIFPCFTDHDFDKGTGKSLLKILNHSFKGSYLILKVNKKTLVYTYLCQISSYDDLIIEVNDDEYVMIIWCDELIWEYHHDRDKKELLLMRFGVFINIIFRFYELKKNISQLIPDNYVYNTLSK